MNGACANLAARDLGLADAGRADHQDVLGQHLVPELGRQLLAPPAVAQRDGDGALGVVLADDVAVELGNDLARTEGRTHEVTGFRA
jgi:hypothetical protein